MRIKSPFVDYYDRAIGYGQDTSRLYLRQTVAHDVGVKEQWLRPLLAYLDTGALSGAYDLGDGVLALRTFVILFCGKLYAGLRTHRFRREQSSDLRSRRLVENGGDGQRVFYDAPSALAYLTEQLGTERIQKKKVKLACRDNPIANGTLEERIGRLFQMQGSDKLNAWCIENSIACAVLLPREGQFLTNPSLEDFQFFKVFGPVETYQELGMFWGGVLAPDSKPLPDVADDYRIAAHGFDKRSFKTAPTKSR
ncbi:hypothetical protein [Burkholderia cenocepacia]|uniref:hypothetical protein n=1 Tax=Burkholderia cenocepacia TaxID=95486 RepID=UPI00076D2C0C|nr:hypothetical protein [Burkholderia cenocepacia]KWU17943.1 hypothetical protein AS149_14815 [Burkholderia cenocepacia]